jgi:5'-3' exonuclease
VRVHLLDGTYELFRHYFGVPSHVNAAGQEVAAARGVVASVLSMFADGATHLAVVTDHVIESFRNALWDGYKDGSGVEPALLSQFGLLEDALRAAGVTVWAMSEYEADDGLAAGADMAARDPRVEQVVICTPDKDLAQCVVGTRVVQFDRRARKLTDEQGVWDRFGVAPVSIPDYLALVGDSADGIPGVPGWGAKSSSTVLARYGHLEEIPEHAREWEVDVRGAERLAGALREHFDLALLFRRLATLVREAPVSASVDELRWTGPEPEFGAVCSVLEAPELLERAARAARAGRPE